MQKNILITGGAGFIGSHLADELLERGHRVRVLDNFSPQVHGKEVHGDSRPTYLDERVEVIEGDVRDAQAVDRAVDGVDVVYHLAAAVGVGQSMYEVEQYTSVNNVGTAVLLEGLIERSKTAQPVERLIVASSMSLYGEGLYRTPDDRVIQDAKRSAAQLEQGQWELEVDGEVLEPVPTPESKQAELASVYALSKFDQERLCLMIGEAYDIDTVALRFFNVYGPRQALSNPYTGVLAIFGSRYLNDKPPLIFEDGLQRRDFVHVSDVARACSLAMNRDQAVGEVFNVGSGQSFTVGDIADQMGRAMGKDDIEPVVAGEYRVGDIRHCFADISRARQKLGYEPEVSFEQGLDELAAWMKRQSAEDRVDGAYRELTSRGLTVGRQSAE
ncbi:MAG: NAD-dependent epimerase/dehydratase family protein [Persicimonas sp.]